MFKLLNRLVFLMILIFFIVVGFFTIYISKEKKVISVKDLRLDKVIELKTGKYNFIWQGAFPWWFSIEKYSSQRLDSIDLLVAMPNLVGLPAKEYKILIPVTVKYTILPDLLTNRRNVFPEESFEELKVALVRYFENEIVNFKTSDYNILKKRIAESVNKKLDTYDYKKIKNGFKIQKISLNGDIITPSNKMYKLGLKHLYGLRDIDMSVERKLKKMKAELERENIKNKQYYLKLDKIAEIIKRSPEILKYIYIDKINNNVKVKQVSEALLVMELLEKKKKKEVTENNGEIDNLK